MALPDPAQKWIGTSRPSLFDPNLKPSCNTSGVLNTKTYHVIICIAHHFGVSENFYMHTLKQVYLYVYVLTCMVESSSKSLYCFGISENPDFQYLNSTLKT